MTLREKREAFVDALADALFREKRPDFNDIKAIRDSCRALVAALDAPGDTQRCICGCHSPKPPEPKQGRVEVALYALEAQLRDRAGLAIYGTDNWVLRAIDDFRAKYATERAEVEELRGRCDELEIDAHKNREVYKVLKGAVGPISLSGGDRHEERARAVLRAIRILEGREP